MPSFKSLKSFAPLALILGFGGLLTAAVIWLLNRQFDLPVKIALAVGVLGFALAVVFNPEAVQRWLGGRQARYGSNVVLMTVAFAGILVIVNYLVISGPIPSDWKRRDMTQNQLYTLAPETLVAIEQLPAPVKAVGFYSTQFSGQQENVRKLLERYQTAAKGKFTFEFHDPAGEPAVTKAYNISGDGTLVLVMGEERQELRLPAEQDITGALIGLSHPTSRVIYVLTGHGEREISTTSDNSGLASSVGLLHKQNYTVLPLSLQVSATVPADARELIIAGPQTPLGASEVKAIGDYLNQGGAVVAMLDPTIQTSADISQTDPLMDYLASAWGLSVQQDVIIDLYNSYYNGQSQEPLFPLNKGYESSPITARLQNAATVFPVARSIQVFGTTQNFPDITYTPLIKTDSRAWGETDMQSLLDNAPQQDQTDVPGPMNLAVSAENSKTKARVVVFGDSDFASDQSYSYSANSLLFLNTVNWAALEESLINLSPKVPTTRTLNIVSNLTVNLIMLITVIAMPASVVAMGIVVWILRRRHV
jgi:ABC-type uncharacterized transport system involved in gliding motility auxiliary subunit